MKYKPKDIGDNQRVRVTRRGWTVPHITEGLLVRDRSNYFNNEWFLLSNDCNWNGAPCYDKRGYEYSWVLGNRADYGTIEPLDPILIKKNIIKHTMT